MFEFARILWCVNIPCEQDPVLSIYFTLLNYRSECCTDVGKLLRRKWKWCSVLSLICRDSLNCVLFGIGFLIATQHTTPPPPQQQEKQETLYINTYVHNNSNNACVLQGHISMNCTKRFHRSEIREERSNKAKKGRKYTKQRASYNRKLTTAKASSSHLMHICFSLHLISYILA